MELETEGMRLELTGAAMLDEGTPLALLEDGR